MGKSFKVYFTIQKTYEVYVRDDQILDGEDPLEVAEELAPIQGKVVYEEWDTDEVALLKALETGGET